MKDNESTQLSEVDLRKRQTLKNVTGIAAASTLFAMPALVSASKLLEKGTKLRPADLGAILVSIPDRSGETLILQNLTDKDFTIDRFHANNLVFDGEMVNCNDACARSSITVAAKDKVLVRFKPQSRNHSGLPAGEYLDVHNQILRLPEGTRYVRLTIHMTGNSAHLSATDSSAVAA